MARTIEGIFDSRSYDTSDSRVLGFTAARTFAARAIQRRALACGDEPRYRKGSMRYCLTNSNLCDPSVAGSFVVLVARNATTLHAETKIISRLDARRRDGHDLFGAAPGFSRIRICQPAKFLIVKGKSRLLRSWMRVSGWMSMAMLCIDTRGPESDAASWPRILCKTHFWPR